MATHRRVLQWLENELFDGNLVLGQQLPSDKDLAAILGVSRGTMREALKILEAQGVLRLYEGSRKSILPMLVREPASSAGPALQLHMATAAYPLRDIVQTRVLLETWALRSSDYRSPAMPELRAILREMARDDISLKEFHHHYVSFHIALVKTAGNTLVASLMSAPVLPIDPDIFRAEVNFRRGRYVERPVLPAGLGTEAAGEHDEVAGTQRLAEAGAAVAGTAAEAVVDAELVVTSLFGPDAVRATVTAPSLIPDGITWVDTPTVSPADAE